MHLSFSSQPLLPDHVLYHFNFLSGGYIVGTQQRFLISDYIIYKLLYENLILFLMITNLVLWKSSHFHLGSQPSTNTIYLLAICLLVTLVTYFSKYVMSTHYVPVIVLSYGRMRTRQIHFSSLRSYHLGNTVCKPSKWLNVLNVDLAIHLLSTQISPSTLPQLLFQLL